MVSVNSVAGLYAKNAAAGISLGEATQGVTTPKLSFADMVEDGAQNSLSLLRGTEGISAKALQGQADMADVVTAVSQAEVTLQTVLSIRDRMVNSFQEIMRMPI